MSPIVHGRIYPDADSSDLVSYTLRILVDPRTARDYPRAMLDIDTLRIYLRDIESPSRITLLLPAQSSDPALAHTYDFMRRLGVEEWPSSSIVAPEAAEIFADETTDEQMLAGASTAWFADADVVASQG